MKIKIAVIILSIGMFNVLATDAPQLSKTVNKQQRVAVLGTGYVGLTLGACLSDFGHAVVCADIDNNKIARLNNNEIPIYEPGLREMVAAGRKRGTLSFTCDLQQAVRTNDVIFIAVGTPMSDDGKADLSAVKAVAQMIGNNLDGSYKLICTKSTVPIGTGEIIKELIEENMLIPTPIDVVSNPEFLKEGTAISDFLYPERVVVGCESTRAANVMRAIYKPLTERNVPLLFTDLYTAETIKYACNAFLATKISFINEIAHLCDYTGANIKEVAIGMGLDSRIGSKFLKPGPGFGGSCFPKDVQALIQKGKSSAIDLRVVSAALEANEAQKILIFKKLMRLLEYELEGKTIGILGLAFKANTDDVRYSPAITLIENILLHKGKVKAFDPVAAHTMKNIFNDIEYCSSMYDAVTGVDAVVVLTEWDEFTTIDLAKVKALAKKPVLLDARNILNVNLLRALDFNFENIGNARDAQFEPLV